MTKRELKETVRKTKIASKKKRLTKKELYDIQKSRITLEIMGIKIGGKDGTTTRGF